MVCTAAQVWTSLPLDVDPEPAPSHRPRRNFDKDTDQSCLTQTGIQAIFNALVNCTEPLPSVLPPGPRPGRRLVQIGLCQGAASGSRVTGQSQQRAGRAGSGNSR